MLAGFSSESVIVGWLCIAYNRRHCAIRMSSFFFLVQCGIETEKRVLLNFFSAKLWDLESFFSYKLRSVVHLYEHVYSDYDCDRFVTHITTLLQPSLPQLLQQLAFSTERKNEKIFLQPDDFKFIVPCLVYIVSFDVRW